LGALPTGAFAKGTVASQADDRLVYDAHTGNLYFDPDGVGGADQVLFATLSAGLKLTYADFFVV
jgi:Ca2+-binding RTX toxin-like protein